MDSTPDPGSYPDFETVIACVLLLISALVSAGQQAISAMNKNEIRQQADDGEKKAKHLVKILEDPSGFFSAANVTVTFFGFAICTIVVHLVKMPLYEFFSDKYQHYLYDISLIILVMATAGAYLVLGVLFPHQIALHHPEKTALKLTGLIRIVSAVCIPFVALIRGITALMLKLTRQGSFIKEEAFSEEEVMSMLEAGRESGAIKEEGKKMIDQIFAFDDKVAYEIMTPRTDVFIIDIQDDKEEYTDELMEMHYSRIPVCDGDSDNIIGILNIKDYMIEAHEKGFENVDILNLLRDPVFVPDTKKIDTLFLELQKGKQHIAVLIDEYGGFSGIVTMEDIIEEIVGDIDDEFDEEEPEIEKISDSVYYIDGSMDLDDVNEETGSALESEDNETVGGLIIDLMGEIPEDTQAGDSREGIKVEYENYIFTVESVRERRIERVRMQILPKNEDDDAENEHEAG
ncbi:MAG: hemolysin family protein [Anaerovoracaceae bacterium]|jgi:putative hemolysin|nr:hemolysin family protein [Anaerovoracaceae bacterium]